MKLGTLLAVLAAPVLHFCMGCNLAGMPLSGADFDGSLYVATNFEGAALDRASFRGAKLVAVNFENADLRGAVFDSAECTACNFDKAKLDGATFSGSRMTAANFKGFAAAVSDAALAQLLSGCAACNFQSAALAGRDLSGVTAIGADFSAADLRHTKLDGAVLCAYTLNQTQRAIKCANLAGARVDGASFIHIRVCTDPQDASTCALIDADSLRRYSGSPLTGAIVR
jgi:uncharacterized protein YjbI with pentapeptide repeats